MIASAQLRRPHAALVLGRERQPSSVVRALLAATLHAPPPVPTAELARVVGRAAAARTREGQRLAAAALHTLQALTLASSSALMPASSCAPRQALSGAQQLALGVDPGVGCNELVATRAPLAGWERGASHLLQPSSPGIAELGRRFARRFTLHGRLTGRSRSLKTTARWFLASGPCASVCRPRGGQPRGVPRMPPRGLVV